MLPLSPLHFNSLSAYELQHLSRRKKIHSRLRGDFFIKIEEHLWESFAGLFSFCGCEGYDEWILFHKMINYESSYLRMIRNFNKM